MSPVLKNKVAVITGASRGLGKAFALRFADEGAKLFLTTTSLERAKGTVEECQAKGAEVAMTQADISLIVHPRFPVRIGRPLCGGSSWCS